MERSGPSVIHVESPRVLRNLRDRLLKKANEMALDIANGGYSFDEYNQAAGRRHGILEAIAILDELEQRERN